MKITRQSDTIFTGKATLLERVVTPETPIGRPPTIDDEEGGDNSVYNFSHEWPNWSPQDTDNFNNSIGSNYKHMGVKELTPTNSFVDPSQISRKFMKGYGYQAYFSPTTEDWHAIHNGKVDRGRGFTSLKDHIASHLSNHLGRQVSSSQISIPGFGDPQDNILGYIPGMSDEHHNEWTKGATYQWMKNPEGTTYHLDDGGTGEMEEQDLKVYPDGYWKHYLGPSRGAPEIIHAEGNGGKEEAWDYWKNRSKPVSHTWTLLPDGEYEDGWEDDDDPEGDNYEDDDFDENGFYKLEDDEDNGGSGMDPPSWNRRI